MAMITPEEHAATGSLTQSERATYHSLRDRGFNHHTALNDALDGVYVQDLRRDRVRHPDAPRTTSTADRRKDNEELTAAVLALAAARDFDQPVTLTARQATLMVQYLKQHKIVPYTL